MYYRNDSWITGSQLVYPSYADVEVDVISTSKNPLRKYSYEGKTFIEGKRGSEFSIRIKNPNPKRVEVVVSVDGLSVINGKKASSNSQGYIIDGFSKVVIDGWRINDDQVRKFYFTDKEGSYSAVKDGESDDCGVISVLAYAEYEPPKKITWKIDPPKKKKKIKWNNDFPHLTPRVMEKYSSGGSTSFGSSFGGGVFYSSTLGASAPMNRAFTASTTECNAISGYSKLSEVTLDAFDLGTGMGKKQDSSVVKVFFNRGAKICRTSIFYASRDSLMDMGIDIEKKPKIKRLPQGFTDYCEEI